VHLFECAWLGRPRALAAEQRLQRGSTDAMWDSLCSDSAFGVDVSIYWRWPPGFTRANMQMSRCKQSYGPVGQSGAGGAFTSWTSSAATMLLCDRCGQGHHVRGLVQALAGVPDGVLVCSGCADAPGPRLLPAGWLPTIMTSLAIRVCAELAGWLCDSVNAGAPIESLVRARCWAGQLMPPGGLSLPW
jgi:hypothetical protein